MTKEEAKIVIGNIPIKPEVLDDCYSITEYQEAKTMAIKALEQHQSRCDSCIHSEEQDGSNCYECVKGMADNFEAQPCEDCISRKAVLDYIYNDLGLGDEENGKDVERLMELDSSYRYVISLSPVIPQPRTGYWIKTSKAVMGEGYMWYCDNCEHQVYQDKSKDYPSEKYCPSCGHRMVEQQESEE